MLAHQEVFAIATMSGYLALGLFTRWLAGTRHFRLWMSWIFATLDVAFIVANVALSAVNTGIPSNYAAGFPSIWLVPATLAFGALRYNPYLQGYVLALMIGGLIVMIGSGDINDGPSETAPAGFGVFFGVPPNVMRGAMIALAGGVLVLAAARARRLLRHAIAETRRRANLTRYLPHEIAEWLAEASVEELRRGRRQEVAVLFCDIRGFTERAETMDPSDLSAFVADFRACVTRAAERHGGVIDKFIGDSAMVLFGVPYPGQCDAADALACARALLAEIDGWNARRLINGEGTVRVGIGLHWGAVFCGAVGDERRLEFTVLGDTVNIAARLEQLTKDTGFPLIVTGPLLDAAGEQRDRWTALPDGPLRGRTQTVRLYGDAHTLGL